MARIRPVRGRSSLLMGRQGRAAVNPSPKLSTEVTHGWDPLALRHYRT